MTFRELLPEDIDRISEISYDVFMKGYYTTTTDVDLRIGTYNYVIDSVLDSTFAEVYEENGRVMGFIMGYVAGADKKYHKPTFRHSQEYSEEFERIGNLIEQCNHRMKRDCHRDVDCEVMLFAMDKECQGKGVGSKLMDDAISHFRGNGCKTMFLFTGDNCNMGYYEKRECYEPVGKEMLDIGNRIRDSRMYIRRIE